MESDEAERRSSSSFQQYMGSLVCSPVHPHLTSAACGFRVPPPSAAHYRLPPLRSSFPSLLHPQYELVKEQCDAWILGFVQPSSPAARRLLLDCLLPRLLCRNIPTASCLRRLIQVTKMISWLIIADDEDDLPDALGADATATAQNAARVMAILRSHQDAKITHRNQRSHQASESEMKKERALEALAELWADMHLDMSPNLRARFISTMADYFDAIQVQAAYRRAHRLPDVEAYIEI